jgi:hypothetical protein
MGGLMSVNGPSAMVFGCVLVRMRMDERSPQGRSLEGHRNRYSNHLSHELLIVGAIG